MPNYCYNNLEIYADDQTIARIINYIRSSESDFDFENIIPMPESEAENWYDWRCENWGTKWNAMEVEIDYDIISFSTAWSPSSPIIAKLAAIFPEAEFWYTFEEPGCCFAGAARYKNGELIYELDGDYESNPLWEEDDEDAYEYIVEDSLVPIQDSGIFEHTDFMYEEDGFIHEKAYIREYGNGKIKYKINGEILYKGKRPSILY